MLGGNQINAKEDLRAGLNLPFELGEEEVFNRFEVAPDSRAAPNANDTSAVPEKERTTLEVFCLDRFAPRTRSKNTPVERYADEGAAESAQIF